MTEVQNTKCGLAVKLRAREYLLSFNTPPAVMSRHNSGFNTVPTIACKV